MMTSRPYQVCVRCVMDTSDPDIVFDAAGVCMYCTEAEMRLPSFRFNGEQERINLENLARHIKSETSGKYDSILGLSGGVDSSYVAYLARKMGLNPLCVHFDNGWNSETSVRNIENVIRACGFDLYTYVIDWPEFRDLQRAFIRAGVIDLEMVSDHAIFASMFKLRRRYRLKYVLSGTNYATEHGLPGAWMWSKMDWRNIRAIHQRYGSFRIKAFPHMSNFQWQLMRHFNLGGVYVEPLNLVTYRMRDAIEILQREFAWQYYGGKHYESTITKFYQAYILPTKFGVDKRKAHLSALIRNDEMKREEAMEELEVPPYEPSELKREKDFLLKKLGFIEKEFDEIMQERSRRHDEYPTDQVYIKPIIKLAKVVLGK